MKDVAHSLILLAERNPNVRGLIRRELLQEGYSVHTVKDGKELCCRLEGEQIPDLILLDPELPYLELENVMQCVLRRTTTLPLVLYGFFSAEFPCAFEEKALALVEKNADPQDLKTTVRSVLKTRALGKA